MSTRKALSIGALILAIVALVGPTFGVPFPVLAVAVMLHRCRMLRLLAASPREL